MRRVALLALAAAALAGCGESGPTTPRAPDIGAPNAAISDGSRTGGNPDFFFLPPILGNPSADPDFEADDFNAGVHPVVSICRLDAALAGCEATIVTFSGAQIRLDVAGQKYQVDWNTGATPLQLDRTYRIRVLLGAAVQGIEPVGGVQLGYADIDPIVNASQMQMRNVNTNEYIALVDGRTLPIKFRVEHGATCGQSDPAVVKSCAETAVTDAGGLLTLTPDGATGPVAGIRFEEAWLPQKAREAGITEVLVVLEDVSPGVQPQGGEGPAVCHGQLVALTEDGRCIHLKTIPDLDQYRPDGQDELHPNDWVVFDKPALIGICPVLPESNPLRELMDLWRSYDGGGPARRLAPQRATFLPCEQTTQIGAIERRPGLLGFASYGLRRMGRGLSRLLMPRTAYAVDLGIGGLTPRGSYYGFAATAVVAPFGEIGAEYEPGAVVPIAVRATITGSHHDGESALAAAGVQVVFSVVGGGGGLRAAGGSGDPLASLTATTNADGVAAAEWVLGAGGGAGADNAVAAYAAAAGSPVSFATTVTVTEPSVAVSGAVRTVTGAPISGAGISIVGATVGVFTNSAGNYYLPLPPALGTAESVQLQVGAPGFVPRTVVVPLTGGVVTQDIVLEPASTIDGILSEPEWEGAAARSFAVNLPGGGTTQGALYMYRTETDLVIGIQFPFEGTMAGATLSALFDEDDDGDPNEPGHDILVLNENWFLDEFLYQCLTAGSDVPTICGVEDTQEGPPNAVTPIPAGTKDGEGKVRADGQTITFELSHPLASADDAHDMSLVTGQEISMGMAITISDAQGRSSWTPVTGLYGRMRVRMSNPLVILGVEGEDVVQ